MHLQPYESVNGVPLTATRGDIIRAHGQPRSESRNNVGLTALDYGDVVYRFQDSGRLEEVTTRAEALHLGTVAVPFRDLAAFVQSSDDRAFDRAGFLVSPRYGDGLRTGGAILGDSAGPPLRARVGGDGLNICPE